MTGNDLAGGTRTTPAHEAKGPATKAYTPVSEEMLVEIIYQAARDIENAWQPLATGHEQVFSGDPGEYRLPESYGRTRVVLLVRDPYWLHCFWDVSPADRDNIRALNGGDKPQILRVHDLTADSPTAEDSYDVWITPASRNWYLNPDHPGRKFQVELGINVPGRGFISIARSNIVTTPPDGASGVIDEDWLVVEEDFQRLYRLAAGLGNAVSSAELMESMTRRLARQMGSGAVSSLSSGFRLPVQRRHFWLTIGTELIVYGATEPDARVTIDGQPIDLRPDGTFTVRYALPDGTRTVPVTGQSAGGLDAITITPCVHKETH